MTTILDVAKYAGLSTATVSRALNSPDVVSPKTRDAVQAAVAALNYQPNQAAQTLKSQVSRTVGVVINRFGSPYFGKLLDGIEQSLRDVGYNTIAESGRETAEGQVDAWMSLVRRQCQSFIVHADAVPQEQLAKLVERYPQTVLLNRILADFEDRCVTLDNVDAGREAAKTLLEHGHRDIAVVRGPSHISEVVDRHAGFTARLAEEGIEIPPDRILSGRLNRVGATEAMYQLLERKQSITAVFLHNDLMAAEALEICRRKGIRVPEDLSIMGFDDIEFAENLNPRLTTLRQPVAEMGVSAARLAHAIAIGTVDGITIKRKFQANIVLRDSVGALI